MVLFLSLLFLLNTIGNSIKSTNIIVNIKWLTDSITETRTTSTILWKQFLNYMLLHKIRFHTSCH